MWIMMILFSQVTVSSVRSQELHQTDFTLICQSTESTLGFLLDSSTRRSRIECFSSCKIEPTCSSFGFRKVLPDVFVCNLYTGTITCGTHSSSTDAWYIYAADTSVIFVGCPAGWYEYKNSCFYLITVEQSWDTSLNNCEQMGGSLASISGDAENNFIHGLPISEGYNHRIIWIGGNDISSEGVYKWVNGDPWVYALFNTAGGDPDGTTIENAIAMWDNGKWIDLPVSDKQFAVCEKPLG